MKKRFMRYFVVVLCLKTERICVLKKVDPPQSAVRDSLE
jgi:hypothetical protein